MQLTPDWSNGMEWNGTPDWSHGIVGHGPMELWDMAHMAPHGPAE